MKICELVAQLATHIPPVNGRNTKIINNIDPAFEADPANKTFGEVLSSLLENASDFDTGDSITLWAKQFHNITVVHLKYKDSRPVALIEEALKKASLAAEQMGGCIYITSTKLNGTSVAFTFLTSLRQRVHTFSGSIQSYSIRQKLSA